ncbi:iron-siderophore ABC transporter substrate-binding protein [Oculatella sp. LEGE 06141]|uniref:ABC transporter substrate-binding protein n=1 Tax=Oculatella sp. LEGE 06141 TaxID=1828648 RepID=UPI00188310CC|nr:iron-siderophore ABC transporter substrate-binding protein [Oculatella sp. LEGE 06141]MBE9180594.1 iron-siderophore ABC transporter substrate-binding protein [Oculatella sp. LEGE 06141]
MIKYHSVRGWLIALLLTSVIGACGAIDSSVEEPAPTTTTADCRTVDHQMGKTEVCGQPERIVVLGPNLLELLLVLEVQPVGFADHIQFHTKDYDNPAVQIPYLGDRIITQPINVGIDYTPNLEALLRSKPDLILGPSFLGDEQYATLAQIAPTLLLDWFDTETNLRTIATTLNRSTQADTALTQMQQAVDQARQRLAPVVASHPKVLMLSSTDMTEVRLFTPQENYCAALVEDLGFQLVYPPAIDPAQLQASVPISLEQIPQMNQADLVMLFGVDFAVAGSSTDSNRFQQHQLMRFQQAWEKSAIAQSLDASKAGRVYFIPAYLCLGLPGPVGTDLYLNELQRQLLPTQ